MPRPEHPREAPFLAPKQQKLPQQQHQPLPSGSLSRQSTSSPAAAAAAAASSTATSPVPGPSRLPDALCPTKPSSSAHRQRHSPSTALPQRANRPSIAAADSAPSITNHIELDMMEPKTGGLDPGRPGLRRNGRSATPLLCKDETDEEAFYRGSRSLDESATSPDPDGRAGFQDRADPYAYHDACRQPSTPSGRYATMHSRSSREAQAEQSTRRKYAFAAYFLLVSLISFCVQTELSAYIQHDLGWSKAYCMMYFTHGSWVVLWPVTLAVLRLQNRSVPWSVFWTSHKQMLASTVAMIELQTLHVFSPATMRRARPFTYLFRTTAFITSALTIAGLSWYIAVNLTTPSDLTAIYNCSAFFAYAFSVPILKEPLRLDKSIAVLIAILGVLIVAYGDTESSTVEADASSGSHQPGFGSRFAGNLVIGFGSVLYGLYEVLYKRYACPPEGVSPGRGAIFANTFGACIGLFTLLVLWIPLPILHLLNIEKFVLPDAATARLILLAVLSNATFSGSFLVLISLTSPVLSSVAALLTIFLVAIIDWFRTGQPLSTAAIFGGSMIVVAFLALSWSTYREMTEHEAQKLAVDLTDSDEEEECRSTS